MNKITEQSSNYDKLEELSPKEVLTAMNKEDQLVPLAVEKIIPEISAFVEEALIRMKKGGRLFYLGAGTSGRLGILDASECPPTFGVEQGLVVGLIAGGDDAIRIAVENAEDNRELGWEELLKYDIQPNDIVVGIAASGTTPYVLGALEKANSAGNLTAGITCNPDSPLSETAQHALVAVVGPEFVTGSTRLKSGTAQKLILNMISTSLMIGLGKVQGNKMVDMQLSNAKLVIRGSKMVAEQCGIEFEEAKKLLLEYGSVRKAVIGFRGKE
ncbi:N-acetylmuramic acid 6-phosphate etherase [Brumimicrobium oceani]|uniref:N-acetylmuramic acid 6-phosphate etherase n=1 Tax=Brumimicrobium oceani TaxID=2100725 RepID=A0A2U2XHJ0_9FLAO|nr:N-acetylmuramic acid 6-phosphate etherase [Brumimicrobium oceani]PWH87243.1 N-acetylmuramic acid 6-phosphate etherase [Brumimicrobium oceani]